ncbi:Beta-glucosidase 44 [Ancistrocladus abbreviatus]
MEGIGSVILLLLMSIFHTATAAFYNTNCNGDALISRKSFPAAFVFGTATSAYQVEGKANKDGRGPSIWDEFVKIPGIIADNSTADVTVDQYHHYKEDVEIMEKLNFDAYRFSISWSRIFPDGTGSVNWKGVAYYNRLINFMLERGITPYANLYHYDLPLALEKKYGGLLNHRVVEDFANYADFCFKTFGDRVKNWTTFNEPRVIAALGYDDGSHAPGRCSKAYGCAAGNSGTEPYIVAHNLLLSHVAAVQRYRQKYQGVQNGRVGILLDFVWYEPLTRGRETTLLKEHGTSMLDGNYPPHYGEHSDWLYNVPWGLYKAITYIKERYGNPTVILSENGMDYPGNQTLFDAIDDTKRIAYYGG